MASPPIARIGDVQLTIVPAANEHLVPLVAPRELSLTPAVKKTLRWMMQKEKLGQDVFLIGPPGPLRRSITFKYAQITQREIEYVCISRDITEGDLKQRREIANGTVQYVNQCCVRAAIEGRILILDGVQNCERNVLPLLNNLLENREMALEDGSFLVHPKRYAALTDGGNKGNVAAELADRKLIPVHPRFFVVALGLPVPPFAGYPLDPPFRSRFQARFVASDLASPDSALKWAIARVPTVSRAQLQQTLAVAAVFHAPNAGSTPDLVDARLPMCPADPAVAARLHAAGLPPIHVLAMLYPWGVLPSTSDHTRNILESVARRFGLTWEAAGEPVTGPLSAAVSAEPRTSHSRDFVVTASFAVALAKLHAAHAADLDVTVVGAKGGGKSHLVRHFVAQLSAASLIVPIYRDMSARDLLQRRVTSSRGDTLWEDAPLVEAMRDGRVAILDGVDALAPGSLGTLERLITNRSAVLPDGTSLVSATHFDRLPAAEQTRVVRIHPDFRIIAIARSTGGAGSGGGGLGGTDKTWISPDTAALMPMVVLPLLPQDEEMAIVRARVPQASDRALDILTRVAGHLATSADEVSALSHAFSLRTLIKIARHVTLYPNDNVHALVHRTTMAAFTPQSVREQLDVILAKYGIVPAKKTGTSQPHLTMIDTPDGFLEVDKVRVPIKQNSDPLLIPHTLFYDNDRQLAVIRDILKDYLRGEHLLLIGNQGTGKNRISDHLCARLRLERQYIQLHRDTTVQALTAVPVVRNGVLSYEDSPLVIAARLGHVLMVDEADKAPTHVTAILKTLVEDGEMRLGDGRRILSDGSPEAAREGDIVLHPEFRMIVLANRPGFPFLGNDFFRECGDVFACHPVENPDVQSEVAMLERYAPTVARPVLERLARAFAELRDEAQSGTINYPYSTREIVNIVKHLSEFPEEGLANVIQNVFAFDELDEDARQTISTALKKHGIPVTSDAGFQVNLAVISQLNAPKAIGHWRSDDVVQQRPTSEEVSLRGGWTVFSNAPTPLVLVQLRNNLFSESLFETQLPTDSSILAAHLDRAGRRVLCIFTNPIALASISFDDWSVSMTSLHEYFPLQRGFPSLSIVSISGLALFLLNGDDGTLLVLRDDKSVWSTNLLLVQGKPSRMYQAGANGVLVAQLGENTAHVLSLVAGQGVRQEQAQLTRWSLPMPFTAVFAASTETFIFQGEKSWSTLDLAQSKVAHFTATTKEQPVLEALVALAPADDAISARRQFIGVSGCDHLVLITFEREAVTAASLGPLPNPYANVDPRATSLSSSAGATGLVGLVRAGLGPGTGSVDLVDVGHRSVRRIAIPLATPFLAKPKDEVGPLGFKGDRTPAAIAIFEGPDGLVCTIDVQGSLRVLQVALPQLKTDLADWQRVIGRDAPEGLEITVEGEGTGGMAAELAALQKRLAGQGEGSGAGNGKGEGEGEGEGSAEGAGSGGSGVGLDAASNGGAARTGKEALDIEELMVDAKGDGKTKSVAIRGKGDPGVGAITDAIREMHDKAVQERMAQLDMRDYDMKSYLAYKESVKKEIGSLRQLVDATQRKQKERVWLSNQMTGELDDRKLVDGLVGDTNIYKRRGEEDPTIGSIFDIPKRIIFSFDLSASMFKFNSHDSRLQRSIEVALLVMQAFRQFEHKFRYEIRGHSGDSASLAFVTEDSYPKNEKEELAVLTKMAAHAQYCLSGDNTLAAVKSAIKDVAEKESDEAFVVVLSDANISQYNIQPGDLAAALSADNRVQASIVFIGTLADQAERLKSAIPGKAFICMDTKDLPLILKRLFAGMMRSNL